MLYYLKDLVLIVLTAIVIASAIEPITKWFMVYKIPRVFSVLLVYILTLLGLLSIFYFFVPTLLQEASNFLAFLPTYVSSLDLFRGAFFITLVIKRYHHVNKITCPDHCADLIHVI